MPKDSKLSQVSKKVLLQAGIIFGLVAIFVVQTYFLMQFNENNKTGWFFDFYWVIFGSLLLALFIYLLIGFIRSLKGKNCLAVRLANQSIKYKFLLKQLVIRDFKRKYKRSVLGILWSFLNPLLMMGVQYIVFSTIFGNQEIPFYPVYLLIGVVFFGVVNEACSSGLTGITDNGPLIKKVSVPPHIFTLSRVLMSYINFALSLIPLVIIMIICKVTPTFSLLWFFPITILLFFFVYGIALFLSAVMVFFRDIQFIWGVFNMLWMYGTPIFYDVKNIGNATFQTIIKCNPLYHYLTFVRTAFIDGTCPDIKSLGFCVLFALAAFVIGSVVFTTTKKRFSFYV